MQVASAAPADPFVALLSRLPADLDLHALARETRALLRRRGVRSGADLLRLGLTWGPGGASLQETAAWASMRGFADLTDEALIQRLHRAAGFFEAVVGRLLTAAAGAVRWAGRRICIADSTGISGLASRGTDWRIHGVYDLADGRFSALELTDAHGGEALDRGPPVAGEIRIADRGFANAPSWQRFVRASEGRGDFIVRLRWNTVRLVDAEQRRLDPIGWLQTLPRDTAIHELATQVQSGRWQPPLPIRVIAWRKPDADAAATIKHLRRQASRKQHRLDPRSEIAAGFVLLATSLPAEGFPAEEILAAYRLRWQIELAFKRLKSLLQIDKIRTRTDVRTRCFLYLHLILALLCEDTTQLALDSFPSGPC
jgi:hypothetical protein